MTCQKCKGLMIAESRPDYSTDGTVLRCVNCGLAIERGERDYFIGSMMFNLVVSETLFAIGLIATLVIRWPNVPWDALQWAAPLAMAAAPFVLFPFSKLAWLGFDILLRPVRPDELSR